MPSLESLIPEIAAYQNAQTHAQRQGMGTLAQLVQLSNLRDKERARQLDMEYRAGIDALGPKPDVNAVAQLALKAGGPNAAIAHADRLAQIKATQENAAMRLTQQASQFAEQQNVRIRNAATAEQRTAEIKRMNDINTMFKRAAAQYNLPTDIFDQYFKAPAESAQPAAQGVDFNIGGIRGTAPDEATAMQIAKGLMRSGAGQEQPTPAAPAVATPQPAVEPTAPPPAAPNNLDARDLRLANMVGSPSSTATATPQMPAFTGSRREIEQKQNQWRLQQAKLGANTPGDYSKTGEEFLKTLSPEDQTMVKKLAAYDIDPKTFSIMGGHRERIVKMVSQYDPKFDQKEYNTRYNAMNRFATGTQGNTVRSLNVAIEHMDTARKVGAALENGDIPLFNQLSTEFAKQTGSERPTNFDALKNILADEVVKGILGGQNALQDRQEMAEKIKRSSSPAQLAGTLNTWTELLGGQLRGLEQQFVGSTGMNREAFRNRFMTPRALEALISVSNSPKNPGGGGWSIRPAPGQ